MSSRLNRDSKTVTSSEREEMSFWVCGNLNHAKIMTGPKYLTYL